MFGRLTLGILLAAGAVLPSVSRAAETEPLSPANELISWQGKKFEAATTPDRVACTEETCDVFEFQVDAPAAYWDEHPGGVEVSIRWASEQDDFELYVYREDDLVASSTGGFSKAESVFIPKAQGQYRVQVAPLDVTDSDYEGIAQWELRPEGPKQPVELLPNLQTLPPSDFKIVAPIFYATGHPVPYGDEAQFSCYLDEMIESGARKCLRFSNGFVNVGDGRLTLKMNLDSATNDRTIYQIIERSNGTKRTRPAGRYEVHATHGHLHYEGVARYELFKVDPETGKRLKDDRRGRKSGFCLIDVALVWWADKGNEPRHFSFPGCNLPTEDERTYLLGISRGWADIYTWDLPDQYIDITGLEDGVYKVVSTADAVQLIKETDEKDNSASVYVEINGTKVREVPPPGS